MMCYLTHTPSNNKMLMFDPMPKEILVILTYNLLSNFEVLTMLIRWLFLGAGKREVKQRNAEGNPGPVGI